MNSQDELNTQETPAIPEAPETQTPAVDPALLSPVLRRKPVEEPGLQRQIPIPPKSEPEDAGPVPAAPRSAVIRPVKEVEPAEDASRKPPRLELFRRKPAAQPAEEKKEPEVTPVRTMPAIEREPEKKPKKAPEEPQKESLPPRQPIRKPRKEPAVQRTPRVQPLLTPETRFRQAAEGQGGRNIRLILCLVLTLGGLVLGFFRSQGLLDDYPNQSLFGLIEMLFLVFCAGAAYDVIADGLEELMKPGFGLSTLVVLESLAALAEGVFALRAARPSYCPLMCLMLSCALWGRRQQLRGMADTMDAARKTDGTNAIVREPGFFQKRGGILFGAGNLQTFLEANDKPAGMQLLLKVYAGIVVLVSAIVAALNCGGSIDSFLRCWEAVMLAGTPLLIFQIWSRPWAILARRLKARGAALYGQDGARRLCGKVHVPVSQTDLFPKGNLKMNGVKFFNGLPPDRVVAYGAAVLSAADSGLAPLFEQQLQLRGARRFTARNIHPYDSGGIGAEIGPDSVLVGTLRFMQSMGVEMPSGTRVSQAVYVAIQGTLAGVFAIHYGVTRTTMENLAALGSCKGLTTLITACDFIVTEPFLKSKFRVSSAGLLLPVLPVRAELSKKTAGQNAVPCVLTAEPDFTTLTVAVSGARALRTAVRWSTILALFSGLMGMVIMAVLAGLRAGGIMSVANLALFLLIWAVPMFLLTGWTRNA